MKRMSILLSLLLAFTFVISPWAAMADYNDHTAYSQFPLLEEGEQLKVTVATPINDNYTVKEANERWFWVWSETVTGIDFEVEQLSSSKASEKKSVMLASNDLPDVLFAIGFTTSELVRYGQVEGQLLDLSPYINEETMPWLSQWFELYPEAKAYCTAPNGAIYTIPAFVNYYLVPSGSYAVRYQMAALEETGLGLPTTVDEFTEALYAMKENHPDATPLGGSANYGDPRNFLLNAFGYLIGGGKNTKVGNTGANVAIKDGEVVIPAYDPDFVEYLELMNQYYTDRIISQDFFTLDQNTVLSKVLDGEMLSFADAAYMAKSDPEFFTGWNCYRPLTSKFLAEPATYDDSNRIVIGQIELSAKCDEFKADKIMRWLDFFYSDLGGLYLWEGPTANSADTLGLTGGYYVNDDGKIVYVDVESGKCPDLSTYRNTESAGKSSHFGNRSHPLGEEVFVDHNVTNRPEMQTYFYNKDNVIPYVYSWDDRSGQNSISLRDNVLPYFKIGYPAIVYYPEDVALEIDEYSTVINPYIEAEVAKFITGARDLAEFENFREELRALGIEDLLKIYEETYADFLENLE